MNSNRVLFNENTNRMPRISSLMSGLEMAQARSTPINEQSSSPKPPTKRNLFGIRLNHDQLKEDLKEMVKEQMESKKYKWNFDFETLKPLANRSSSNTSLGASASQQSKTSRKLFSNDRQDAANIRFKWAKVNTLYSTSDKEMGASSFDKDELAYSARKYNYNFNLSDDDNDEEEEDDDALAIPQFYKYQRQMKLNEDRNRLKYLNLNCAELKSNRPSSALSERIESTRSFEPIFKFAMTKQKSTSPTAATTQPKAKKTTVKKANKVVKPKAVKRTNQGSLVLSPSTQNLIITFSENRKDTLRSAQHVRTRARIACPAKKCPETPVSTNRTVQASATSAFVPAKTDNLKQQTLLDLFKQRKRRNSCTVANDKLNEAKNSSENTHYLRSAGQTTSTACKN